MILQSVILLVDLFFLERAGFFFYVFEYVEPFTDFLGDCFYIGVLVLVGALQLPVSQSLLRKGVQLTDSGLRTPIFLRAGSGSGKSRFLGRLLLWQYFLRGVATVCIDPHGQAIANFLDCLDRLPDKLFALGHSLTEVEAVMERLWSRVRYIDLSGKYGYVVPRPLYYRLGDESLYVIAQRYIDLVRKIDPYLLTASIEGFNAYKRTATYTGMLLAAIGLQITEAEQILRNPLDWIGRAKLIMDEHPDELPAVISFLRELGDASTAARNRMTGSYFNKLSPFILDPVMRATFGVSVSGSYGQKFEEQSQIILIDGQFVHDAERREFLLRWELERFLAYAKHRGPGRHRAISVVVDELAALMPQADMAADFLAHDLDELINQIARNYSLHGACFATQEIGQYSQRLQRTLLWMDTQIQGVTKDARSALLLAEHFMRYAPYKVKKYVPQYLSDMLGPYIVQTLTEEFTQEEQLLEASYMFMDQRRFEFLVRMPRGEGDLGRRELQKVSIAGLDPGVYPNEERVEKTQRLLMQRDGQLIQAVLEAVNTRNKIRVELHTRRPRRPVAETRTIHVEGKDEPEEVPIFTIDDD